MTAASCAPTTSAPHRFEALDSWRGVSAICVVLLHFPAVGHLFGLPFVRHSYLFVDFFFVLSGFVITHAYTRQITREAFSFWRFAIRRLGRVYPLHFAVLLLFVALEVVKWVIAKLTGVSIGQTPFDAAGPHALSAIPVHLLLLQALHVGTLSWNFPSWSISAEVWTYCLFGLLAICCPRGLVRVLLVAGLLSAALLLMLSTRGIETENEFGLLRCIYGFSIGAATYKLHLRSSLPLRHHFASAAELVVVVVVFAFVSVVTPNAYSIAAPLVFALCVYVFSFERGAASMLLLKRPFRVLGQLSYSIYMLHFFVFSLVMSGALVAARFSGSSYLVERDFDGETFRVIANANPFVLDGLLIGCLLLIVAASFATRRWIELPAQHAASRIADHLSDDDRHLQLNGAR